MPRLLLFDIDGTLLNMAGGGMRALGRAVHHTFGFDFEGSGIRPDGRTDPLIVSELLLQRKIPMTRWQEVEVEFWENFAAMFSEEMALVDARRRVEPGVPRLLDALCQDSRFRLGVLTGNMELTAKMKLAHFDLGHYFPIGAYASDCSDRCRLGRIALERARRHYKLDFRQESTWLIGDTDNDIRAAHAFGARVLAVATGNYSIDQLQEFCPDAALPDLADTDRVLEILAS